jgi:aspartyl protease family protein
MIAAAVWLGLVGVGYVAFERLSAPQAELIDCRQGRDGAELVVAASRDGHFYIEGELNGTPLRFMVDTGASYVAVDRDIAAQAGVRGGQPAVFNTAAGQVQGLVARGQRLRLGCLQLPDVVVAVNPGLGPVGLLGQNVLRRFEVVQTRERLLLRAQPAGG